MILAGNFNNPRLKIFYRMIRAPVPELQLISGASKRKGKDLVTKADPEDRYLAEKLLYRTNGIRYRGRVTWAIISAADVSARTTWTLHPCETRSLRIFCLAP